MDQLASWIRVTGQKRCDIIWGDDVTTWRRMEFKGAQGYAHAQEKECDNKICFKKIFYFSTQGGVEP